MRYTQQLSQGGSHLGGVTVTGLHPREHEIRHTQLLYGLRQGEGRRQCIGSGELAVGKQNPAIGPQRIRLFNDSLGLRRPP